MTTTAKAPSQGNEKRVVPWPLSPWASPPLTTEDRLKRIEALGDRIAGYVRFMCQVGNLGSTSSEVKDKAIIAFYERIFLLEAQLSRIQEDLRLA
jgi:hypothetical protein